MINAACFLSIPLPCISIHVHVCYDFNIQELSGMDQRWTKLRNKTQQQNKGYPHPLKKPKLFKSWQNCNTHWNNKAVK